MGGLCTGGTIKHQIQQNDSSEFSGRLNSVKSDEKQEKSCDERNATSDPYPPGFESYEKKRIPHIFDSGELNFSIASQYMRAAATKEPHMSSFLGKAGIVGLEKAVDVLDTLGSSMANLHAGGGFASNLASRGNKVSILAFEVANTIVKGSNLLQSMSEENIQFLKNEILHSEGVQRLVSTDMTELLRIAAADKREEFNIFSREVIRFGDLCKDPQWHNLDRYFSRFGSDPASEKLLRDEAELTMQELITLAQYTSELYHELHALDRFEQDYQKKVEELESLHLPRRGEGLLILHSELKHQRKLVKSLKKKSLWTKSLEEVVEKLVDIVTFIHQHILEVFGDNGMSSSEKKSSNKPERLGVAGLALHYARIITQIDNIASRPTFLPPNMRDGLYNGLPLNVKTTLRSRLQPLDVKDELSNSQFKAQMERTLTWLVPIAADTTKAHQGFGWVGEWANTSIEYGKKTSDQSVIRLQTLYHADMRKMDQYILELVIHLHRLISFVKYSDKGSTAQPAPYHETQVQSDNNNNNGIPMKQISSEERKLLDDITKRRKLLLGNSKSQEFVLGKRISTKVLALSRSAGSSPTRGGSRLKCNSLDVLDGIDTHFEQSSS